VRGDWDELKQHDVVFLVTVRPPDEVALGALRDSGAALTPAEQYGLVHVRGAEVIEVGFRDPVAFGYLCKSSVIIVTSACPLDACDHALPLSSRESVPKHCECATHR
jgi:hypothetical protein